MPANVCCPNCWVWSELGSKTTCRRCGAPLILPDGRRLDVALSAPPPPPPPHGYAAAAVAPPPVALGVTDAALRGFQPVTGMDWVGVCRWITIGYGALCTVGLIAVGLLVQHISVPITDPATGVATIQTFNIGPAFAIAAIVLGGLFAVFAWLTQYTVARVIFLVLDLLALLSAVSQVGIDVRSGGVGLLGLVGLCVDVAYGGALVMSLLPRSQPAYH